MRLYRYGGTYHIFPYCRGIQGRLVEVPTKRGLRICEICREKVRSYQVAEAMVRANKLGLSYAEIGRRVGLSRQAVSARIKRYFNDPLHNMEGLDEDF